MRYYIFKLDQIISALMGNPPTETEKWLILGAGFLISTLVLKRVAFLVEMQENSWLVVIFANLLSLIVALSAPIFLGKFIHQPIHSMVFAGVFLSIPLISILLKGKLSSAFVSWVFSIFIGLVFMNLVSRGIVQPLKQGIKNINNQYKIIR